MAPSKYLFVGSQGCGKTSLILALLEQFDPNMRIAPTQGLTCYGSYIDLPGNYCDNPDCYSILSVCSQQAQFIVLVIGADQCSMLIPEGFTRLFIRPVIGVITKIDDLRADCEKAEMWLHRSGVTGPFFRVSARNGAGITVLRQYLQN